MGGGITWNKEELKVIADRGIRASLVGQILIEEGGSGLGGTGTGGGPGRGQQDDHSLVLSKISTRWVFTREILFARRPWP